MTNHKLFKVNQNAVLRNKSGEILILQKDGKWMLPGGRLEEDKTWLEGLEREIREETKIRTFKVIKILNVDLSDSGETYIVTFLCETNEDLNITLSKEHQDYKWIKFEDVDKYEFWHEKIKERLKPLFGLGDKL